LTSYFDRVGAHYYQRRDVAFNAQNRGQIQQKLENGGPDQLAGMPVRQADDIDGRRLVFEDAWLIARFSGTEPLLRIYAEATRPETVTALLDAAMEYLGV
jgi:phosphomannomutase